jgi:hypothetical protein
MLHLLVTYERAMNKSPFDVNARRVSWWRPEQRSVPSEYQASEQR